MPDGTSNGPPSVTELARRLQRVEDKLDERIVTTDMLRASEKLYEAREVAHAAATQALEQRVTRLEAANTRLMFALVFAFLTILVSIVTQVLTATGGRT